MGPAVTLDALSGDRNNNFNLLRFAAASAVILGHSILLSGQRTSSLGWSLGYAAVNCFFVISGFLVCRSFCLRGNLRDYLACRTLRLYPALLIAVAFCVFGVGLWMTPVDPATFLGHEQTRRFLWHNSLLFVGQVEIHLPGLFSRNPYPGQVNAPLWTLQYELGCYLLLALLGAPTLLLAAARRESILRAIVTLLALVCMALFLANVASSTPETGIVANGVRLGAMFFSGAALYLWRQHIRLSHSAALLLVIVIVILALSPWRSPFVVTTWLALPYLLLYLAYVPGGALRCFNRLGDYSYGLYVFAFPLQQLLVWYLSGINAPTLFLASMTCTLPLAMLSWHCVEKPALALKPQRYSSASTIR